jgi:hypothetical protein
MENVMSSNNEPAKIAHGQNSEKQSESNVSGLAIGWAMVGGIGLLMLLGYVFR